MPSRQDKCIYIMSITMAFVGFILMICSFCNDAVDCQVDRGSNTTDANTKIGSLGVFSLGAVLTIQVCIVLPVVDCIRHQQLVHQRHEEEADKIIRLTYTEAEVGDVLDTSNDQACIYL